MFDIKDGRVINKLIHDDQVNTVATNGQIIVTATYNGMIHLWSFDRQEELDSGIDKTYN